MTEVARRVMLHKAVVSVACVVDEAVSIQRCFPSLELLKTNRVKPP